MAATVTTTATATATIQQPLIRNSRAANHRSPSSLRLKSSFSGTKLTLIKNNSRAGNNHGACNTRMADSAAGSYAAALAEVAVANGTLEATVKDVELLEELFSNETNFNYFTSPIITLEDKRKLLDEITASGKLQSHVCNFLNILVESKRIDLIKDIVKEFELVYNKLTNTELAIVASVVPLEEQHLSQIAKQVQKLTGAKNVRVKTVIDESLVAGFTIRYGNSGSKLIDMSVKKQLEEIAAQLEIGDISLAV
ncbi:ATPase, F1 complex, OSCP/delta subunit [Artemisia annua]|uniref:ATPase, F1 complex, OSCP/delta subunit n=1 Tax=Artemisia annua TaxID=35608 RepID=A0A2U1QD26_ARTAN|nr:ATPase, F1 complex, OSCP/delta subunit [Artemisia annua]PWA95900.1 ATPase, F1 complex, OSCP/delta subunit [Artemisia annua]